MISCNKKTSESTQKLENDTDKELIEEAKEDVVVAEEEQEEKEEEFNINNIFGKWTLDEQVLEPSYANFIGNRSVIVDFNGKSNHVVNYLIDTTSADTTIIEHGYVIQDRIVKVYDLQSQENVTHMYLDTLRRKNMVVTINYDKFGQSFKLKYIKFK
ncbi:MAG: hypothetical protein R2730_05035 [Chitinophagales bacterium]